VVAPELSGVAQNFEHFMQNHLVLGRLQHGVIGAMVAALAFALFITGGAIRSCLPDRPGLIPVIIIEVLLYGYIVSIPAILAGFLIGFFVRFRLTARAAVLCLALLLAGAFAAGYFPPGGNCLPA
jgi:hypothetical protein